MHAKRVCKDFEIKDFGEYHDLYLKIDQLLVADVFENFRKMCLKIYHLDPLKFLSAPGLAWQAALKKTEVKLELLTDIHMLLMIEKGIREGICHAIYQFAKANNKYMKDYDKNKESSYLNYWDVNNLYGWAMSQKLPVNNFEWREDTSQFNEDFIKNYNEEIDEGYFLEVDIQYPEKIHELYDDLPFLRERMKIEKVEKLVTNLLNLINHEPDIDKKKFEDPYENVEDPYEAKYQLLINKRESSGLNHFNDSKAFIEYSNDMDDIYKNIEEYSPNKKQKVLIVFDDTIADILSNKKA